MESMHPFQPALIAQHQMTDPATSVEVPIDTSFPEAEADALARYESFNKHLYRPNTYLHKWWARRSGTTFRHILKQLVADHSKRDYYEPGGLENVIILDPMMGGGTTLHEAIRMGANCVGIDVDPIPVMQAKASLQYHPLLPKKRAYLSFENQMREMIGRFFITLCPQCLSPSEVQYTLHALRRSCKCHEVAILDSYVIREDPMHPIKVCGICGSVFIDSGHNCQSTYKEQRMPVIERSQHVCHLCGTGFSDRLDIPFWQRYIPIAIVGKCKEHGTFYKTVDVADITLMREACEEFARTSHLEASEFAVFNGPKSRDLLARGVQTYLDVFTRKQLLFLECAIQLVRAAPDDHRLWLGLLISTSLEFNSLLCGYKGAGIRRPGAIRHVFSHHAYSFPYTALENNPIFSGNTSGTLGRLFHDRIEKASKWAEEPIERCVRDSKVSSVRIRGEVDAGHMVYSLLDLTEGTRRFFTIQADFRRCDIPNSSVDYVVTDPPYYDSVQYGDLSAFFRVWLDKLLPREADWSYDYRSSAVAEDATRGAAYGLALTIIWDKCRRVLRKPHGRLIFTFHHWKPCAWAELTLSLKRTGFTLRNRYVVLSENPLSVHIRNLNALKHDCVLVLEPARSEILRWRRFKHVNLADSRQFCMDCGAALGFFLQSDMSDIEIRQAWEVLLRGNANVETSC